MLTARLADVRTVCVWCNEAQPVKPSMQSAGLTPHQTALNRRDQVALQVNPQQQAAISWWRYKNTPADYTITHLAWVNEGQTWPVKIFILPCRKNISSQLVFFLHLMLPLLLCSNVQNLVAVSRGEISADDSPRLLSASLRRLCDPRAALSYPAC